MVEEEAEVSNPSEINAPAPEDNAVEPPSAPEPDSEAKGQGDTAGEPDAAAEPQPPVGADASEPASDTKEETIDALSVDEAALPETVSMPGEEKDSAAGPAGLEEAGTDAKPAGEEGGEAEPAEGEGEVKGGNTVVEKELQPEPEPGTEEENVDITSEEEGPSAPGAGDAEGKTFMEEMHDALLPEGLTPEIQAELAAQGNTASVEDASHGNAEAEAAEGEDDAVDIDGPGGAEMDVEAAQEAKPAEEEDGQEAGDVDILGEDADGEGGGAEAPMDEGNGEGEARVLPGGEEEAANGQDGVAGQEGYAHEEGLTYGTAGGMEDEDEEEEDIDIVEVDEEEEAKVKQAMGVGEGMPLGEDEYAADGEDVMLDPGQEGPYSNGDALVEGEAGLEQALAEAEAAAGVAAGLADAAEAEATIDAAVKGKRAARVKRKMLGPEGEEDEEAEPDILGPGDLEAARRTRQRTARPPPQKKKRMQRPEEDEQQQQQQQQQAAEEDEQTSADLEVDLEQLQAEAMAGAPGEPPAAAAKLRRGRAASTASLLAAKMASVAGTSPGTSPHPRSQKPAKKDEPLVKFAIKSFTVPELVVALPESSTVGQLKKAVMDAAMKLLGGGLRVRVLLQGKRLQDEATSLSQAGISRATLGSGKVADALAFMLEPTPLHSINPNDNDPLLVLSQAAGTPSPRPVYGGSPGPQTTGLRSSALRNKLARGKGKVTDDDADYDVNEDVYEGRSRGLRGGRPARPLPSPHTTRVAAAQALAAIRAQAEANQRGIKMEGEGVGSSNQLDPASGALVLHPSVMDHHGLGQGHHSMALVQHPKPRSTSLGMMGLEGRRRIRRPFTVQEVGSLVEAVEKLGTGRWRDVKMYAFPHAHHRTYVDLKDKWKTLVHTAQIAPHQRRGEPVPQDLLERVTKAHAYWTAQLRAQQEDRDH